jgi:hypothetical protein
MSVFTVDTDATDIENLMDAVSNHLRQWEGGENPPLDISPGFGKGNRLSVQTRQLKLQWNIDSNAIIHSTRPRLGPWIIHFQTIVRRLTWWFLEPIVQQIRSFQMNNARVTDELARSQELLASRTEELARRVEALENHKETTRAGEEEKLA